MAFQESIAVRRLVENVIPSGAVTKGADGAGRAGGAGGAGGGRVGLCVVVVVVGAGFVCPGSYSVK